MTPNRELSITLPFMESYSTFHGIVPAEDFPVLLIIMILVMHENRTVESAHVRSVTGFNEFIEMRLFLLFLFFMRSQVFF